MAFNPDLGYDPTQNTPNYAGPQTREQWVADTASTMLLEFLNADGGATSPLMSASLWQQAGIPLPPQDFIGFLTKNPAGAIPPNIYNSMSAMANWLADHPDVATASGIATPAPTVSSGPPLSDTDQGRIAEATQAAADRQNSIDVAKINANTSKYSVDTQAATAAADRAEQARQFNQNLVETQREFDLQRQDDRQQFTATLFSNLLDTATQWAKQPVDWVAHQFFMQNMGIPLTIAGFSSIANLLGAFPPSGPSAAGAVVGGPAVIDGNTTFAQNAGIPNAGFVAPQVAAQSNPGKVAASRSLGNYSAATSVQRIIDTVGLPAFMDHVKQEAQRLPPAAQQLFHQGIEQFTAPAIIDRVASPTELPGNGGSRRAGGGGVGQQTPPSLPGTAVPQSTGQYPSAADVLATGVPVGGTAGGYPVPATAGTYSLPGGGWATVSNGGGGPGYNTLGQQPPTGFGGGSGDGSHGIYTGPTATPPPGTTGTGAQQAQGSQLLQQLANATGIPLAQLQQLIPPAMLAGGYSPEQLAQTPIVQSIRNQTALPDYRTAPVGDSRFGTIQALNIPLNIRGGQDLNAANYLQGSKENQQLLQGAIEGTGAYFPDELERMLRSSTVSNYQPGGFGRQLF